MTAHERWTQKFQIKGKTWVFVPNDKAVKFGLTVKNTIAKRWKIPKHYFHLLSGGHVRALEQHLNSQYFLHLDIVDFFGNFNRSRITRSLKKFYPDYDSRRQIAIESTVRLPDANIGEYILPYGFVQSPILASICLEQSKLGGLLKKISNQLEAEVTVYMDDIVVSGNNLDNLRLLLEKIRNASIRSALPLNDLKQEGPGDSITAFNIQLSHGLLKITEERMNQFLETYKNTKNAAQRKGILNYVASINLEQRNELLKATIT